MKEKLIHSGLAIIGACYYATVGKWFWKKSTLYIHQKKGEVIPCPLCSSHISEFCCSVPIFKDLSLFDNRTLARKVYNLSFIPSSKIRTRLKKWEGFVSWPKKAVVDYYWCSRCDIYFQNAPIDSGVRIAFYSEFYRNTNEKFGRPHFYTPGSRFHLWAEYLKKYTGLPKGAKVLDIGCAEGFLVLRLKELGYDAYGIEPSEPMVRYGCEELGLETLTVGNYTINSYPEDSFVLITSYHVIEHVEDHKAFLEAVFIHLKPGGYFVISTPCAEAAYEHYKYSSNIEELRNVLGGGHHILFTSGYLSNLMKKKGFILLKKEVVNKKEMLLPGRRIAASGEKWLGMNIIAKKSS